MTDARALRMLVGEGVRRLRLEAGLRQEDVAHLVLERLGLRWSTSRVTDLERGDKAISAEELIALTWLLRAVVGREIGVAGLIDPTAGPVALTPALTLDAADLAAVLVPPDPSASVPSIYAGAFVPDSPVTGGAAVKYADQHFGPGVVLPTPYVRPDVADYRAATKLGQPIGVILEAARECWGMSLTDKRDEEVAKLALPDATSAQLKTLRMRVTRELMQQLTIHVKDRAPLGAPDHDEGLSRP